VLIRDAEVAGTRTDLRWRDGVIVEIAERLPRSRGEEEVDGRGAALVPGLHDHHIHLLSLAASLDSISCGPPDVESVEALGSVFERGVPIRGWLRGTGYFESVAGPLDRDRLDAIHADHPVRIQHRSGAMWFLNSRAIAALDLDGRSSPSGIERDASGRATGRIFRGDDWLRQRLPSPDPPDLRAVGSLLARCGVTRVTDATPTNGSSEAELFRAAQRSGALSQRLRLMGGAELTGYATTDHFEIGEVKILFDESALPDLDRLVEDIREAHASARNVAIHPVTRPDIHFASAAIAAAGAVAGDRLEHASIAPPESMARIHALGLGVVTQPNFIAERGDAYRVDVDETDLPHLYRVKSWLDRSIPLAGGTDAPFGHPDPWKAIRAAVFRETRSHQTLGKDEIVTPECAFGLFSDRFQKSDSDAADAMMITVGQRADLCLLDAPWHDVRRDLSSDRVRLTIRDGKIIFEATH
jgi:predicted amidohydrolase YtcJ